ncbi:hypothetical protein B0H67DRAFT_543670 [Lasiosphaeris hirsuta]|uniref:Dynamin N-terminal domain-containing protein n=1 Tax=Lasiosphaeris hirsuta TaxID=260670 RepID=A0AA40A2P1_9PEZI|nr:hypothetical protein B0H67DRAFT_543670 [Lasiosphaeris hirsuta]
MDGVKKTGSTSSNKTSFAWGNCTDKNAQERVFIKQQAVDNALQHGMEICSELRNAMNHEDFKLARATALDTAIGKELLRWIQEIETLNKGNHALEILVGVAGDTGAGKTTILNNLLGMPELLPSSNCQASTACACRVSFNNDDDPNTPFRAEITFRSYDDVAKELDEIFEYLQQRDDLKKQEGEDHDDEEYLMHQGAEMEETISEGLKKIHAVWGLDEDRVMRMTPKSLLDSNANVLKVLGITKTITSPKLEGFAEKIKPYLDSSTTNQGFKAWPLITEAKLFVKADFLKHGLVLVDLPGLSDAVESRANVAERFFQQLEVTTIVTPARRAIDGRTGVRLMSDHQTLRMQLDGKYHKKRFCVVVSQVDEIDCDVFIKDSAATKNDKDLQKVSKQIQILTRETGVLESRINNEKKLLGRINEKLQKATDRVTAVTPSGRGSAELKKGKEQLDRKKEIEKLGRKKAKMEKTLTSLQGRQKWSCVQINCSSIATAIKETFAARQKRLVKENGENELYDGAVEVIPVSATAFRDLTKRKSPVGFPGVNYTGIPRLRQWLADTALNRREEHLDAILNSLERLFLGIQRWSKHKDNFLIRSANKIKAHNPLKAEETGRKECRKVAGKVAIRWAIKNPQEKAPSTLMAWTTFQAILARDGGPYKSKGRGEYQYNFPEALTVPILDMALESWHDVFHVQIPAAREPIGDGTKEIWDKYIGELISHVQQNAPGIAPHFGECAVAIRALQKEMRDRISAVLCGLSGCAAEIHPEFLQSLRVQLKPIFQSSLQIKAGLGQFAMRRKQLHTDVRNGSEFMFTNGYKRMKERYNANANKVPHKFEEIAEFATSKALGHVDMLFENLETFNNKDQHILDILDKEKALQERLQKLVMVWLDHWYDPKEEQVFTRDEDVAIPADYAEEGRKEDSNAKSVEKEGAMDVDEDSDDSDTSSDEE